MATRTGWGCLCAAGLLAVLCAFGGQAAERVGRELVFVPSPPPPLVYENETVPLTVTVSNPARVVLDCRLTFALDDDAPQVWRLSLGPGKETVAVFTLKTGVPAAPCRGRFSASGGEGGMRWEWSFELRDGRGELSGLRVEGAGLANADGDPTVLVNRRENETEYRRWAPVKAVAAAWRRRNASRWWMTPTAFEGVSVPDGGERFIAGKTSAGHDIFLVPYEGDPLAAMLAAPGNVPVEGSAVVALAWGFHEAYARYPLPVFARALDLAVDRLRDAHPEIQIVLVTPPPIPGEAGAVGRYAEEVRRLAREHHTELVDWHDAVTRRVEWESLYALPGDDGVTGLYPNDEGLRFLRALLAEALW